MTAPLHIPRSLLLQWHLTERCNLRCAHCYQGAELPQEVPLPRLLEILGQFESMLADLRQRASPARLPAHLTLTGGEPFVRQDFLDFLEIIASRSQRYSFAILTNGTLIEPELARTLKRLGPRFVQVSLEGTQATHDRIRGPGNFERTVSAIRALRAEQIPTFVSFTAHRDNFREFPSVARLGQALDVTRVWADRLIPIGDPYESACRMLSPEETREFFQLMAQARPPGRVQPGGCEVAMHRALQFLVGGGEPYHCTAGDSLLTILPDGTLYPCRRMPIRIGNVLEQPLAALYQEHELLRQLRDPNQVSAGCERCAYSPLCRGGLKCLSYAARGTPFQADPGCWIAMRQTRGCAGKALAYSETQG
jgi:radical SAM protein with 4Fe4S-binding SPASM domain